MRYDDRFGGDVEPGDLMIRPKHSGIDFHYGTAVSSNLVAHKTPELGKHLGTRVEFCAGLPCWSERYPRTAYQKAEVVRVAVSDLGSPWFPLHANCEHDATRAQFGIAYSPTVNRIVGWGLVALVVGIAIAIANRNN
ncbi:MAG: hypothetical protein ABSD56_08205 [Bryobacteraceae bacterium]